MVGGLSRGEFGHPYYSGHLDRCEDVPHEERRGPHRRPTDSLSFSDPGPPYCYVWALSPQFCEVTTAP